jgi:hypothetical protein
VDYLILTQRAQREKGELRYLDVEGSLFFEVYAYGTENTGPLPQYTGEKWVRAMLASWR